MTRIRITKVHPGCVDAPYREGDILDVDGTRIGDLYGDSGHWKVMNLPSCVLLCRYTVISNRLLDLLCGLGR